MKFIFLACVICLFRTISPGLSDELPELWLKEGTNKIAISIISEFYNDISNIHIKIENSKLPEWLYIESISAGIDVLKGTKSRDKLFLIMNVNNSPNTTSIDLPLTLKDNKGNQWDYTLKIHVNSTLPFSNTLYANYPNPFNPLTTIRYSLKEKNSTKLEIFNSLGQKMRTLVNEHQSLGIHEIRWDGTNDNGEQVSSGIYFYRLISGSFIQTRRMMIVE